MQILLVSLLQKVFLIGLCNVFDNFIIFDVSLRSKRITSRIENFEIVVNYRSLVFLALLMSVELIQENSSIRRMRLLYSELLIRVTSY